MNTKKKIVLDTTSLISYYDDVFQQGSRISRKAISIIRKAFTDVDKYILIIPSIVFVELFDKWFKGNSSINEEFRAKFRSEILNVLLRAENVEIRELDTEVLDKFIDLYDKDINLENRDKIILASAIVLKASLITSDAKIHTFLQKYNLINEIIS